MPVFHLTDELLFPPPELAEPDGLLAVGGDLSEERLLAAYSQGIFPWYSENEPILWWAPSPRLILEPKEFRVSRRLARTLRQKHFRVTFDTAFQQVIESCATIRTEKGEDTWITHDMHDAYCGLHEKGFAHSVECWRNNELAGGLYGVSIGSVFFGESMFSRERDSSKAALAALVELLLGWDFDLIDCQLSTEHLQRMGAREIAGAEFYAWLEKCLQKPTRQGKWTKDAEDKRAK